MRWIDDTYDDDYVLRDKERLRVPLNLMDAWRRELCARDDGYDDDCATFDGHHRPSYLALTDQEVAARREARDGYIRALATAWRMDRKPPDDDGNLEATSKSPRSTTDARALARAAYDAMCVRLRDAWRPQSHGDTEELMRRHTFGAPGLSAASDPDVDADELLARHMRARDTAYADYKHQLSNAWRGGRTDPRAAAQVEERLEREKHGRDEE